MPAASVFAPYSNLPPPSHPAHLAQRWPTHARPTVASCAEPPLNTVVTIGTFDGVHRGHAELLRRARVIAGAASHKARVAALVFDPNPIEALRPSAAPPRLTTFDQKTRYLRAAGADDVVQLRPTPALLSQSPDDFLQSLRTEHHAVAIVEGPDFRFGKARAGDVDFLRRFGDQHNISVEIADRVEVTLTDHTVVPASSSLVRLLVSHGRVRDASLVLGRPFTIAGTVVRGDRRGRTIGFPTANIDTPCLLPADGVYAGRAILPNARSLIAAVSVGTKPQFNDPSNTARCLEAFLWDPASPPTPTSSWAPLPGLDEYGWPIELELVGWVRDQATFPSLDSLLDQIRRDCARIHDLAAPAKELLV